MASRGDRAHGKRTSRDFSRRQDGNNDTSNGGIRETGVYFRLEACRPCSLIGWRGEENRGGNT